MATPGGGKKASPSSGGMPGMGISPGDISNVLGKLRKVSSEDKKESFESSDGSAGSQVKTDGSFQGKVNLFKQAEGEGQHFPYQKICPKKSVYYTFDVRNMLLSFHTFSNLFFI